MPLPAPCVHLHKSAHSCWCVCPGRRFIMNKPPQLPLRCATCFVAGRAWFDCCTFLCKQSHSFASILLLILSSDTCCQPTLQKRSYAMHTGRHKRHVHADTVAGILSVAHSLAVVAQLRSRGSKTEAGCSDMCVWYMSTVSCLNQVFCFSPCVLMGWTSVLGTIFATMCVCVYVCACARCATQGGLH